MSSLLSPGPSRTSFRNTDGPRPLDTHPTRIPTESNGANGMRYGIRKWWWRPGRAVTSGVTFTFGRPPRRDRWRTPLRKLRVQQLYVGCRLRPDQRPTDTLACEG